MAATALVRFNTNKGKNMTKTGPVPPRKHEAPDIVRYTGDGFAKGRYGMISMLVLILISESFLELLLASFQFVQNGFGLTAMIIIGVAAILLSVRNVYLGVNQGYRKLWWTFPAITVLALIVPIFVGLLLY
jgi:hypothetical protein